MSCKKQMILDSLFWVQITGACVMCGSQFLRFLDTTDGQLLSMFLVMEAYFCLNIMLAIDAHCSKPSRATRQLVWTYALWIALIGSNIVAIFLNGNYTWSENDTKVATMAIAGTAFLVLVMRIWGMRLQDPMLKSLLGILFKAVPQLVMSFEIMERGGGGIPVAAILAGHVTASIRVGQVAFTIFEAGWDRNRVWLGVNEAANELSWVVVTIVWLFS